MCDGVEVESGMLEIMLLNMYAMNLDMFAVFDGSLCMSADVGVRKVKSGLDA